MKERFKNGIVADLLIIKNKGNNKKILLAKRKNTGYKDGEYEIPGGHLEENEDLYEAMIREAREELGILLQREDLRIIHIMHHYTGNRINFIFLTEREDIKPKIMEEEKCEELKWVDINDLPENTMEKVKKIIGHIREGELYSNM